MASGTTDPNNLNLLPPQDIEAEQMVLGACFIEPRASIGIAKIKPDDFYKNAHRLIYSAMQRVHERGEGVDLVTVRAELDGEKEYVGAGDMGKAGYLAYLVTLVPTAAFFRSYEKIVIDRAQQRAIQHICREGFSGSQNLKDPNEQIADIVGQMNNLRRLDKANIMDHREIVVGTLDFIEQRMEKSGAISGVSTGIRDLDFFLDGLQPQFYILGGRPSMGKTALAEGIRHGAAKDFFRKAKAAGTKAGESPRAICARAAKVGFISIEMGPTPLGLRAMSRSARIPLSRLRRGDIQGAELDNLGIAAAEEVDLPIVYAFSVNKDSEIKRVIDYLVQVRGCGFIIVDYLQLMASDGTFGTREQEVSSHSRMFQHSVQQHGVPHLILCQLNRGLENRPDKRPMPSDLRESGGLEQDADVIMFVYRDEVYHCKCPKTVECSCGLRGKAELIIGKGRNEGVTTIELEFEGKYTSFADVN